MRSSILVLALAFTACAKFNTDAPNPTTTPPAPDSAKTVTVNVPTPPAAAADPTLLFGGQDKRGAFQEAVIAGADVKLDYFTVEEQMNIKSAPIGPETGASGSLYFQDGVLRTRNPKNTEVPPLDEKRLYAVFGARVGFDDAAQAQAGIYKLSGIVTLVTGMTSYGPMEADGQPAADFNKTQMLMNPNRGLSAGAFNKLGNGKNDRGRIESIELRSKLPGEFTLDDLRMAVGGEVQVRYPK